jgi:hypothetical protein
MATAEQRTHEKLLREIAATTQGYRSLRVQPEDRAAFLAGADALARVAALEAIIRDGIPRYLQNGGCSNCGGVPHTSTCLVGQLAAALGVTPDAPGGTR